MSETILYFALGVLAMSTVILGALLGKAYRRIAVLEFELTKSVALFGDRQAGFKRRERI
jgi:hypothetical protein